MAEFSLWSEKYRPKDFDSLSYNLEVIPLVQRLCATDDIPHLLFYGPNGAGKRTMIRCTLNQLFGEGALKMKSEIQEFEATKTTTVECVVNTSSHHIEVNPSEADRHDKAVVNHLIKETASARNTFGTGVHDKPFKVVVIHEVD